MKRIALLALFPLLFIGLIFVAFRYLCSIVTNTDKALNIADMIDQSANVGANGRLDETISARAAKAQIAGRKWGCILCKILNAIQTDHCKKALAHDITSDVP